MDSEDFVRGNGGTSERFPQEREGMVSTGPERQPRVAHTESEHLAKQSRNLFCAGIGPRAEEISTLRTAARFNGLPGPAPLGQY